MEAAGASAPPARFPLAASGWTPIKAKRPEKGCRYRGDGAVSSVRIKTGKLLKVVARADDLGVPLATDPRPVRLEVRHGDVRHCVEFGPETPGGYRPDERLLARKADQATTCPAVASPSDAPVD